MYENTKAKANIILKLFQEGRRLHQICESTSSSKPTVKKVLRSFGIDYEDWLRQDYERRLTSIPVLYAEGKSQSYIEQHLQFTRKTIREALKKTALEYRSKSQQWRLRHGYTLNEHCFDELTPNSLYWIGMLYADGHVTKSREHCVELTQHKVDVDHLRKFCLFLGLNREPTENVGNCLRIRFGCEKIHQRLLGLGLVHNKSYTAVPHYLVKKSRDFWRGVVDGDGGVYNPKNTPQIGLSGTLETIFGFIIFCSEFAGVKDKYPSESKNDNSTFGSTTMLYQVSYYGQDAVKVGNLLYDGAETYLERKYNQYLKIKNREFKKSTICQK